MQKPTWTRAIPAFGVGKPSIQLAVLALMLASTGLAHATADEIQTEGTDVPAPVVKPKPIRKRKLDHKLKSHDAGVAALDASAADAAVQPVDAGQDASVAANVFVADAGAVDLSMTAAAPHPAPSSSAAPPPRGVDVRVRDTVVLTLRLSDGGMSTEERARRANRAIERALGVSNAKTVRIEPRERRSIVFIAEQPVVELTVDDAAIAGEGSLELYSASVAARIADILRAEEQRDQRTHTVLSIVAAILAAVVSIFFMRKIGDWSERARNWAERNPQRIPAIRYKSIEVVRSPVLHGAALVTLSVVKWLALFGIAYACLMFILSRFDATRGYTDNLANLVLAPLSTLTQRVATLLPLSIIVALGAILLWILLRFIGLFFAAVERGETRLEHMSPALAAPTSLIVRVALVVVTMLVIAPALTGNAEGTFAKLGQLAVAALLLASVPLLTTVFLGMRVLYTNRLAVGQWVSIGNVAGRVLELTLFETRIWVSAGVTARVPHLLLLWQPVRATAGNAQHLELTIMNTPELASAVAAASTTAATFGADASVTLESISRTRATLVVRITLPESKDKNSLLFELVQVLADHGVELAES